MPRAYSTGGTESRRRKRTTQPLGCIYFIQEADDVTSPVKIGYCAGEVGLAKRLQELQVGNPYRLRIVGMIAGTREAERQLHVRFGEARMVGEWFGLGDGGELCDFLDALELGQVSREG